MKTSSILIASTILIVLLLSTTAYATNVISNGTNARYWKLDISGLNNDRALISEIDFRNYSESKFQNFTWTSAGGNSTTFQAPCTNSYQCWQDNLFPTADAGYIMSLRTDKNITTTFFDFGEFVNLSSMEIYNCYNGGLAQYFPDYIRVSASADNVTWLNVTQYGINSTNNIPLDSVTKNGCEVYEIYNFTEQNLDILLNITALQIFNDYEIQNFSIITAQGTYETDDGNIIINVPESTEYYWNVTFPFYFNYTEVLFNKTNETVLYTIVNVHDTNLFFTDNETLLTIQPTCTYDTYTITNPHRLGRANISTNTTSCALNGYQSQSYAINSTNYPQNLTFNMSPNMLSITFSNLTSGYVTTVDDTFLLDNVSGVYIPQYNLSIGYVTVSFNPDATGKYQQIFTYYNDNNTHISEYLELQAVDLVQPIKATDEGDAIEFARICAYSPYNQSGEDVWTKTYCDHTDITGTAYLVINDQNEYKFCAEADGFEEGCIVKYITPSNTITYIIELVEIDADEGYNYYTSSCNPYEMNNTDCIVRSITYTPSTICYTYTAANLPPVTVCEDNVLQYTLNLELNSTTTPLNITVSINNQTRHTFRHTHAPTNYTSNVGWEFLDGYKTALEGEEEYLVLFYAIMIAFAVLAGFIAEQYFKGYGILGSGIWFAIMSVGGFYIFWIPTLMITLYYIIVKILPTFSTG